MNLEYIQTKFGGRESVGGIHTAHARTSNSDQEHQGFWVEMNLMNSMEIKWPGKKINERKLCEVLNWAGVRVKRFTCNMS